MEWLENAASVSTLVFVISGMLAVGLGLTPGEMIAPLRNFRLVMLALAANFAVMPLLAIGLAKGLRLDPPLGTGLGSV